MGDVDDDDLVTVEQILELLGPVPAKSDAVMGTNPTATFDPLLEGDRIPLVKVYAGVTIRAEYCRSTGRVRILSAVPDHRGLVVSFSSPSSAAVATVTHINPLRRKPDTNGWLFWKLDDGTGRTLKDLRPHL